jgi:hypothetical protein
MRRNRKGAEENLRRDSITSNIAEQDLAATLVAAGV